ncbi:hypothetical protein Tco_1110433 [Tanacetum coccineum]|uniref:Reverse transcriptase Ty1/copia-type domain-containing protein n=1 Tax=Tanacetum coccineum TaxID=301880 RepID=A0ABQ5IK87_9ASTR
MFDESLNPPPYVDLQAPEVIAPIPEVVAHEHAVSTGSPSSTTVDQDAPSPSNSPTTQETQTPIISHDVSSVDPTLFIRREGKELLLVQIYVDDIIFAASTPELFPEKGPRIFINQSKYALESLKKYGFESCDPVDTPMVEKSKLDEDKEGKAVDPSHYRGMIGTLLYLTASRPDLQFAICMCARYQARPTEKHLNAHFADEDHAGCQDTCRSTSAVKNFWVIYMSAVLLDENTTYRLMAFDTIKFQCTEITKALMPYSATRTTFQIQASRHQFHFIQEHVEKERNALIRDLIDFGVAGEAKTTSTPTSPTTQAQVTYVSESVSYSKFEAKTFKVNEELRKVRWWEIVRRRPTATTKNHMILSYDVLIIQVLSDIEDSHGPSDAMHNPLPATQSQKDFVSKLTEIHSFLLTLSLRNIRVNLFTMKMEILLESTSNKLMVEHAEYDESNTYVLERFNTSAGNPVKKILLKLNLSDHRLCKMVVEYMFQDFRYSDTTHLSRSVEVLKLKKFQERCNIKAFQEWYEHVGPEVASPQGGKVSRWQRDCAWLMISRCSRSQCQIQVQGTSSIQEVNDHYNIFTRESQEYELKTKDKA